MDCYNRLKYKTREIHYQGINIRINRVNGSIIDNIKNGPSMKKGYSVGDMKSYNKCY